MPLKPLVLLLVLLCWSPLAWGEVHFNRDIRPLLADRCFACHGPDARANHSGLRLDLEAAAKGKLPDGGDPAIIPGNPDASGLLQRILSSDPDLVMPPPESNLQISPRERELLRQWIAEGAPYAEHWSFVAPHKPELPPLPDGWTARNPIDHFIGQRLLQEGLTPSPTADRDTLIRRLSFDLTGLPPSVEEVLAFREDPSPEAYSLLVERLLASPHFGERMALDWLDAARYADTNGFSIDGGRHMWLWRDWVIQAFNSNLPYNQFLTEQLAGDLLPNATPPQRIASGFQRNNMVTHEGGTIPEENLTNYNADRVQTLGEAILGLTLGCAQCHDHKYDPITQKDYYSLFAYFNTLGDIGLDGNAGVNPRPQWQAPTVLQTGEEQTLRQRIDELRRQLAQPDPKALAEWEAAQRRDLAERGRDLQLLPVRLMQVSTPNRGAGFELEAERFVRVLQPSGLAAYDVLAQLPETARPITGLRVVFHPDEIAPGGGWGFGPQSRQRQKENSPVKGSFRLTAISVSAGEVPADQVDLYRMLPVRRITANTWQSTHRPELSLDMRNENGWAPQDDHQGNVHLTLTFGEPLDPRKTPYLTAQLNFGAGDNLIATRMELFALLGSDDGSPLPEAVIDALQVESDKRSDEQQQAIRSHFSAHAPQTERLRIDLQNAEERLAVQTSAFPVMVMNVSEKPRPTFILKRGDYSQPTLPVSMDTPEFLPRLDHNADSRLKLAEWITQPDHPLTARVYVNRVWQMLFGSGIVRTPSDFGSQGEWPTHPELLDWLAVDFVEHGWDVKRLVKLLALSATYQQVSHSPPALLERDPLNLLLARGPRFRLPAEFIRDAALRTSGLLVPQLGGPSVNPYTPGDLWREISHYGSTPATAQTFVQDHGEKLYRRSLYTYWKRTAPPPNLVAFDAPNRETCVVSRPSTNTPLQALVLLNDVQFVEAARAFAERILHLPADDRERITYATRAALARDPSPGELEILLNALDRERNRYRAEPALALHLLAQGESPRDESLSPTEHAAWMQLASTLFNLSESITRH